jgi:hypothetical protein
MWTEWFRANPAAANAFDNPTAIPNSKSVEIGSQHARSGPAALRGQPLCSRDCPQHRQYGERKHTHKSDASQRRSSISNMARTAQSMAAS